MRKTVHRKSPSSRLPRRGSVGRPPSPSPEDATDSRGPLRSELIYDRSNVKITIVQMPALVLGYRLVATFNSIMVALLLILPLLVCRREVGQRFGGGWLSSWTSDTEREPVLDDGRC